MKLIIDNGRLIKQLSDEKNSKKAFGELSDSVYRRIQYLEAAETLADVSHLPPHRRHVLTGKYKGCFAICVDKRLRIIFKPNEDGNNDISNLSNIREVCIIAIEDYHD
ncbi:MAG TPA: type II toxin-antitoxin system RelE/ParE family toxin [Candidatus Scatocola faecigallinarum]|nr:MAG TPA: RelE-like toxin of type II toxin-antitoxin system HigB [Caudoviricetes sp.]HIV08088.1 type II toxin-antitoxin system RelE/ParE family toxin [Candidatus Scatocola faecigallinarum]